MIAGSITVTGSTSTSITIRLSSIVDATYYRIAYRKSSEASPTIVEITGLVYTITGLSPATEYAINYRGCNADGMGPYMDTPVLRSTAAPLSLWSWTASNGAATTEQVKAAYQAVTTKGKTADFSLLVWNDLVDNTLSALVESGLSWDNIYTKLADTKMTAAGDALTAKKFNSLVKNLRYPWMYWACKPNRNGYLGRLAVESGDIVYGAYLLELAHALNVMVDAIGDKGAGYATLMAVMDALRITTTERLRMRSPQAAQCVSPDVYLNLNGSAEMLAFLCRQNFVTDMLPSIFGRQTMVSPMARRGFLADVLPSVQTEPSILSVPACIRATTTDTISATTHDDSKLLTLPPTKMLLDDYLQVTSAENILMQSGRPLNIALSDRIGRVSDSLIMVAELAKRYLEHSASLGSCDTTMIAAASGLLSIVYDIILGSSLALSASPSGILLLDDHFGPVSDTSLLANLSTQLLANPHLGSASDTKLFPSPSELLRADPHFGPTSDTALYPSPSSRLIAGHNFGPSPDVVIQPDESDHLVAGHHLGPSPNVVIRTDKSGHLGAAHHIGPSSEVAIKPDKSDHFAAGHHTGPVPDVIIQPGKSGHLAVGHHLGPVPDVVIHPDKSGQLKAVQIIVPALDTELYPSPSKYLMVALRKGAVSDSKLYPSSSEYLVAALHDGPTSDSKLCPSPSEHLSACHHTGPASDTELFLSSPEYLEAANHDGPTSDSELRTSPSKYLSADHHTGPSSDTELFKSPSELLRVTLHFGAVSDSLLIPDSATYLSHIASVLSGMGAVMETEYRPGDTVTDDLMSVANAILRWAESVHMQHAEAPAGRLSGSISLTPTASLPIQDGAVVGRIWFGAILPMIAPEARKMLHEVLIRFTRQDIPMLDDAAIHSGHTARHGFVRQDMPMMDDASDQFIHTERPGFARQDIPMRSPGAAKCLYSMRMHTSVETAPVLFTPASSLTVTGVLREAIHDVSVVACISPDQSVGGCCIDTVISNLVSRIGLVPDEVCQLRMACEAKTSVSASIDTVAFTASVLSDKCTSVCGAVLSAKPTVEPTSDWVVVDGTNLKIFRTYYNRTDDADSTNLLIDDAYYEDPIEDGANLYITSEGYNDYGLGVDDENST